MTQQNYDLAQAYVAALAGSVDAVMDWRALHDTDKSLPGHAKRGTLAQMWSWLCAMNQQGHGIFCNVSAMDGIGRETANVQMIRAHVVDHDSADAEQQFGRAAQAQPAPGFVVYTSPRKYHTYWPVAPYLDIARFKTVQRKLRTVFNGDPKVIDATRVLRVPGLLNHKYGEPWLVTCEALAGYGQPTTVEALEAALAGVTVVEAGEGERLELGAGDAAPSLEWLQHALTLVDPAELDRDEWLGLTAAVKQAGWTLADEPTLRLMWDRWCARYPNNDPGENDKLWRSITSTELGWRSLTRRVPSLQATLSFGTAPVVPQAPAVAQAMPAVPMPAPPALDCSGEFLTHLECEEWFKGCTFVTMMGKILTPSARFLNATQFNAEYGGKQFIISGDGAKKTDEAWKAATRSTLYQIPKVDHIRFMPERAPGEIVTDALGRRGVNMYVPAKVRKIKGDPTIFLNHLAAIIPDENDRKILIEWMAHVIKYPGWKIPWAPVIQSVEGIGKGAIKDLMTHCIGLPYVHFPNAQQLGDSGGKFNGWMRNKIFILADEIKVDEKRHMIEVLKPLISERLIEVQAKGENQEMEDNPANWGFFTNYKDAVPFSRNGRRYAMFFSPIQTEADLLARGMNDAYFKVLYDWMAGDGAAIMAQWFDDYRLERGAIPMRAPKTSSTEEAINIGRSPIQRVIEEAIEDGAPGFRAGWVSSLAVVKRCRDLQAVRGNVAPQTISGILDSMGYTEIGRADRPWFQEDREVKTTLYALRADANVALYGRAQGYE